MGRGPRLLGGWAPVYKRHKPRVLGILNKLLDYLLPLLVTVLLPRASSSLSLIDSRPLSPWGLVSLLLDSSYLLVNRVGLLTLAMLLLCCMLVLANNWAWRIGRERVRSLVFVVNSATSVVAQNFGPQCICMVWSSIMLSKNEKILKYCVVYSSVPD